MDSLSWCWTLGCFIVVSHYEQCGWLYCTTAQMFFKVLPIYPSTRNVWEFWLLPIFDITWHGKSLSILAHLMVINCKINLHVSKDKGRTKEVEHLSCIHWLFWYVSVKCLFKLLAHFSTGFFVFLLICSIKLYKFCVWVFCWMDVSEITSPFLYSLSSMLLMI